MADTRVKQRHTSDTLSARKLGQFDKTHDQTITAGKGGPVSPQESGNQVIFNNLRDPTTPNRQKETRENLSDIVSPRGVLSLGLPLGISSLKLGSRHRRKQKRHYNDNNGHQSDGEVMTKSRDYHWYQALNKSSHTINDEVDLIEYDSNTPSNFQNANSRNTKSHYPAERKSSLPRKSKMVSSCDELLQRPRSVSVDADQLIQSVPRDTCRARVSHHGDTDDMMKFAGLTSPSLYMMSRDKSSSGNSSGSDVSPDTDSDWPQSTCASYTSRGRAPVSIVTTRGPPPRHLLPAKLRPSPGVKCHPFVMLPHRVHKGKTRIFVTKKFLGR